MPSAPPRRPVTTASPTTWPVTRRERQPSALRVPNSRTRRATADEVSRPATRNAAARTTTDSHRPTVTASPEAVDRDPDTVSARSSEVVTVASGTVLRTALFTASSCCASSAWT